MMHEIHDDAKNEDITEKERLSKKNFYTCKTLDSNSCPFTKLSKFVCSILTSKINSQIVKNDPRKDDERYRFNTRSKIFEKVFQEYYDYDTNSDQSINFKQKKFSKLLNLFQTCENYYSIMMLNGNSNSNFEFHNYDNENLFIRSTNKDSNFLICEMCLHYLCDPITLICGCTFCKLCLDEYNQSQFQIAVLKQYSDPTKHLFKCKTCGFSHNQNSSQNLNQNISISKIIDKSFSTQIDIRYLRNDIRRCIYLKIIDYDKAEKLLQKALSLDETNHLILADLFFLNFFNQSYDDCYAITDKLMNILPTWPLAHFLRSLCHQLKEDFNNMSLDLSKCLQLDNDLEYVKSKLSKLSVFLKNNESENSIDDYSQSSISQSNKYFKNITASNDENCQQENNNIKLKGLNEESTPRMLFDITNLKSKIKSSDLECSLCYRLLYDPVSTPCGHVFCCACLDRSLDHQDKCPLCKRSLSDYLAERRQFVTKFLDKVIQTCLKDEYIERKLQYEEELSDLIKNEHEIPIFVCTLALPGVKCPLHIYEPRYRLMLRRALATTKQFGMCVYLENNEFANYGCMLEIKQAQFLRDGRALIETVGGRRFKVIRKSVKDGYNVADVEWLKDIKISNIEALQKLNKEVYELARQWYEQLPAEQKAKILESFGISQIPYKDDTIEYTENGPDWHWFLLHILPLDTEFQLKFLSTTNLMARLSQLKMILRILLKSCEKENTNNKFEENLAKKK